MKKGYVYILTNKINTVLYIGVTSNLEERIITHKNKLSKGFTSKCNLTKMVYLEGHEDIKLAIEREKQLKRWHRE